MDEATMESDLSNTDQADTKADMQSLKMPDDGSPHANTEGGRRRRHKKRKSHRKRHRGGGHESACGSPQPYESRSSLTPSPATTSGGKRRRRKSKKHRRKSTRKGMRRKTDRRSHKR
jgi:hypothetical protein